MKLVLLILVVSSVCANMFNDGSDFMKGFETGIMMRTKNSKIDEFGCTVPDDKKSKFGVVFEGINFAMEAVKPFLPDGDV